MARTIALIKADMDAQQALETSLSGLTSPSQTAIYELWKYIVASAIYVEENLTDVFKAEVEAIALELPVGTESWLQNQVFNFQYSATNPQIVTLVNFVPTYATVSTELQIITRASVKTGATKVVNIKVAKNEPPEALATLELNSLKSYLTSIQFAGVQHNTVSLPSDKCYLEGDIYYNGNYSGIIVDTVIAAIDNYLANIPFDGLIRVSRLEDFIQQVPGVIDYRIKNMAVRPDASGVYTYLVQDYATLQTNYPLFAGYVIQETNSGSTFTDKLNFIAQ